MAADKVELLTRKAGENKATRWESSGDGSYTIESVDDAPQGTSVNLHLKPEDAENELDDYASEWRIRNLVKKYSDFIAWPIRMEVEDGPGPAKRVARDRHPRNRDPRLDEGAVGQVQRQGLRRGVQGVLQADRARLDDPLEVIAMKAEGTFEYQALLFSPSHAPFDLFNRDAHIGIQLYVKPCSSWVIGTSSCRILALHRRRCRRTGHVAQRFPRNLAAGSAGQGNPSPSDQKGYFHDQGSAIRAPRRLPHFGPIRQGPRRGPAVGLRQPGTPCYGFPRSSRRIATRNHHPRQVRRAHEGRPEADLLHHRRTRQQILKSPHLEAYKAKGYEVLLLTEPVDRSGSEA